MFHRRENRRRRSLWEKLRGWLDRSVELARSAGAYVVLAVVAVAVPYLVFLGYRHVVTSPYFQVSDIQIEGATHADVQSLAERAQLKHGVNIFDVEPTATAEIFESSPWVRDARVDRQLPDRVVVEVEERRPGAVLVDDGFFVVDRQGRSVERLQETGRTELLERPLVTGLSAEELERADGRQLMREAIRVADLYDELGLSGHKRLSEIHVDPVLGLSLMTEGTATEVRLGRGEYRARLKRLKKVRRALERRDIEPAYILLDREGSLERITVGRRQSQGTAEAVAE